MVSFCERNVWTGPFCVGLPKLFVSVLFVGHVGGECSDKAPFMPHWNGLSSYKEKWVDLCFLEVIFPQKCAI